MTRQPGRIGPTARKVNVVTAPPPARLSGRLHRKAQETETVGDITSAYGAWLDRQVGALPITVKTKVVAWRDYLGALVGLVAYPLVWVVVSLSALVGVPWYLQGLLTPLAAFWAGLVPLLPAMLVAGTLTGRYGWLHWHTKAAGDRKLERDDDLRHTLRPKPKAIAIEALPWRKTYVWQVPPGMTVEEYKAKAGVLRDTTGKPVTITSPAPKIVRVNVHLQDLLAKPLPWAPADPDTHLIPIGIDQDGFLILWDPLGHSLLVCGIRGSGKSAFMNGIIPHFIGRAPVYLIDPLEGIDLGCWHQLAEEIARTPKDAMELLRHVNDLRIRDLKAMAEMGIQKAEVPHRILGVDELSTLTLKGRSEATEARAIFEDLLARGRKTGDVVIAATQYPSVDVVPEIIRGQFTHRLGLRVQNSRQGNVIHGEGSMLTHDLSTISPAHQGRGCWDDGASLTWCRTPGLWGPALQDQVRRHRSSGIVLPLPQQAPAPQVPVSQPANLQPTPIPQPASSSQPLEEISKRGLAEIRNQVFEVVESAGRLGVTKQQVMDKLDLTPDTAYSALRWLRDGRGMIRLEGKDRWVVAS